MLTYKNKLVWIVLGGLLVLSLLVWIGFRKTGDRVFLKKGNLVEAVYSLGTVKSEKVYHLKFGIASAITQLYAKEGQTLEKGAPLLANDSGIVFKSPIEGTITKIAFTEGEIAMPGLSVLEVTDLKNVYLQVSLDQESAMQVKPGQVATLSFESMRGHTFRAKVNQLYPSNGQFLVRLDPETLPSGILPDMTADVAIEVDRKENVLLIPLIAVNRGKVTRIRNGSKSKIEIKIGAMNSEFGELVQGDLIESDELLIAK